MAKLRLETGNSFEVDGAASTAVVALKLADRRR